MKLNSCMRNPNLLNLILVCLQNNQFEKLRTIHNFHVYSCYLKNKRDFIESLKTRIEKTEVIPISQMPDDNLWNAKPIGCFLFLENFGFCLGKINGEIDLYNDSKLICTYQEHSQEIMSLSCVKLVDSEIFFLSLSKDCSIKLWRSGLTSSLKTFPTRSCYPAYGSIVISLESYYPNKFVYFFESFINIVTIDTEEYIPLLYNDPHKLLSGVICHISEKDYNNLLLSVLFDHCNQEDFIAVWNIDNCAFIKAFPSGKYIHSLIHLHKDKFAAFIGKMNRAYWAVWSLKGDVVMYIGDKLNPISVFESINTFSISCKDAILIIHQNKIKYIHIEKIQVVNVLLPGVDLKGTVLNYAIENNFFKLAMYNSISNQIQILVWLLNR